MIEQIYWAVEILAIILCVHNLFSQKIRININSVAFIVVDLIYMNLIDKEIISRNMFFLIYIVLILYSYFEFQGKISNVVVQSIMTIAIISVIQMIVYLPCILITGIITDENVIALIVHTATLVIVFITRRSGIYKKLFRLTANREWIVWICIAGGLAWLGYCTYQIKTSTTIDSDVYTLCITLMVSVVCIMLKWQNEYYEKKQKEKQLEMTQVYDDALNSLIDITRKNQHDYKNHLLALQGMRLTAKTTEELIKMQREYCAEIEEQNKYTKILNGINNPILAGFLFCKLTSMAEEGIQIEYDVSVDENEMIIPAYDLNEIIGILLDNAVEAVKENVSNLEGAVKLELHKCDKHFRACVKNISKKYTNAELEQFFSEKYTTKGIGRGIGLEKIKDYQKKYKFEIFTEMSVIDDKDWLSIGIVKNI